MKRKVFDDETECKKRLCKDGRNTCRGYVFVRIEDRLSCGTPDLFVTAHGWSSWWEAKYANPDFDSQGIQELMMLRLALHGYARYIIYNRTMNETRIVEPRSLNVWRTSGISCVGLDNAWVLEQIRKVHTSWQRI